MSAAPSRDDTLLVARLAGWPVAPLGTLTVGPGEAAWREMVGRSTPADRTQLGQSLPPVPPAALLEGDGRRRLIAYHERHAGRPPARTDAATLERSLTYVGDLSIKKILINVLVALPPAVVDLVVTGAWIFGVGREAAGWYFTAPPFPALEPDADALRVILLSGHCDDQALAGAIAHELAHLWLEPALRVADVRPPAEWIDSLSLIVGLAHEWRVALPWGTFTRIATTEHRAVALATAWGYPDDGTRCAKGMIRIALEEATHRFALDRAASPQRGGSPR